jgi:23S rRNA (uracil1939-C5)-methyltransferase
MLCSHVPLCGGCSFQEIDYSEQLSRKETLIKEAFSSFSSNALIHSILPCASPWRYRNKMEFSFSQNRAGDQFLGLMIARSRGRVLNLNECLLTSAWFSEVLNHVREWWKKSGLNAYHPYSNKGSLLTLTLREGRRTQDKMAILTVSGEPEYALTRDHIAGFVEAVQKVENMSIFLCIRQQKKGSPTQFFEMHLSGKDHISEKMEIHIGDMIKPFHFKISPRSFFQPNPLQAEILYSRALEMAKVDRSMHVLDLYCGTATLSMIFALQAGQVTGMELSPEAVLDAECNLKANGIENVTILSGDVAKILETWQGNPHLVCVDPPRSGLSTQAVDQILGLNPDKILYVSCNPLTQAENVKVFIEKGYLLEELQPVDQFPHTKHVENIAVLRRT